MAADVAVQFSDLVLDTTGPTTVAIEGKFEDNEVSGAVVKFETNAPLDDPDFYVELTSDESTPLTNANFLSYVNSGAYDNSIFHRSVLSFVIQGGGYKAPIEAANHPDLTLSEPVAIANTGTIQNEPGNPNTRGTIAMAKPNADPDGARSQFFFNLGDNNLDQSGNPGGFLDSINGGYTQFGSVLGSGMTVVDSMNQTLTFQADSYYGNTDFEEGLPLYNWGVDEEGEVFREGVDNFIILPEDFVKIENVDVVAESDLFTYTVSSSDEAKLTASVDGNGNLALTPDSSAYGSVDVTITATSKLDNSTASDTFSVQLGPALTAIEEAGNITLNRDSEGNLYANTTAIKNGGRNVNYDVYASWGMTAIAVEQNINGGNAIVFNTGNGSSYVWQLTDQFTRGTTAWQYTSNTSEFDSLELAFGVDIDGNSYIGAPNLTPIETAGTVSLQQDGSGLLFAGTSPIMVGTTQFNFNTYASWGMTAIAVEDNYNGNKALLFRLNNGSAYIWTLSDAYAKASNGSVAAAGSTSFREIETEFEIDIDSDTWIGTPYTPIESEGNVALYKDSTGNLYANRDPIYNGAVHVNYNTYASWGMIACGVDDNYNGSKALLFKINSDRPYIWELGDDWSKGITVISDSEAGQTELAFGVDVNNDSYIGPRSFTVIEDAGSITLNRDSEGNLYANTTAIKNGGRNVNFNTYASWGMTAIAVEDDYNGNKALLFRLNNGSAYIWTLNDGYTKGDTTYTYQNGSAEFDTIEIAFGVVIDAGG